MLKFVGNKHKRLMAKKSKSKKQDSNGIDYNELLETVTNTLTKNGMSYEDIIDALQDFKENSPQEILNRNYDYKAPDYAKMVEPLHPALNKLIHHPEIKGITASANDTLEQLKSESHDTASKALINALYYILAHQKELQQEPYTSLPLFAIFHIMIELKVEGATPAIIEMLSQDAYFTEFFFAAFEEDMVYAISKLCKKDLKLLEDYMYATGRIFSTKCIVADAVIQMALTDPMLRISVIAWFARVLKKYSEIIVFEPNIDHITHSLARLHADELRPLIERLYTIKDVPFIEIVDKKMWKQLLNKGCDEPLIQIDSLLDTIKMIEEKDQNGEFDEGPNPFHGYSEDDDEDDYYYDDEDDDEDDEDTMLVDECEDGMDFRLEISLDNCHIDVTRELIVPSNIRLNHLGKILVDVMGWDGSHLDQFIKGREVYCTDAHRVPWRNGNESSEFALNELLKRKGSKITWEYDFGDSWMHTVRLTEKIKRKGKSKIKATKAANACPPDDCGGVWGYENMLDAIKDENHPDYEIWEDWIDEDFDPHAVSLADINARLKHYNDML